MEDRAAGSYSAECAGSRCARPRRHRTRAGRGRIFAAGEVLLARSAAAQPVGGVGAAGGVNRAANSVCFLTDSPSKTGENALLKGEDGNPAHRQASRVNKWPPPASLRSATSPFQGGGGGVRGEQRLSIRYSLFAIRQTP